MKLLLLPVVAMLSWSCASKPPRAVIVQPRTVETQRLSGAVDDVFTSSVNVDKKVDAVKKTAVEIDKAVTRVSDKSKELSIAMERVRSLASAEKGLAEALDSQEQFAKELAVENDLLKGQALQLLTETNELKQLSDNQQLLIRILYAELDVVKDQAQKAAIESETMSVALSESKERESENKHRIASLLESVTWWRSRALLLAGFGVLAILFFFRKPISALFGVPLP